ncbi:MAG: restriction endonuclease [Nitrospira sp.]|nr:restriction endonuclease [Nitrospira sp.]
MTEKLNAISIDELAGIVLSASKSIDIVANLDPKTRLGSVVSDALGTWTALADQRLRLRCLIHWPKDASDRSQVRADTFEDEISRLGWAVRNLSAKPLMDLIIVDDKIFHALIADGAGQRVRPSGDEDALTVRLLLQHFNELWSAAAEGDHAKELLFEDLFRPSLPSLRRDIVQVSNDTWDRIIQELARQPQDLFRLNPRRFEELVAQLLERDGLRVQLTPKTRDGGRDILAFHHGAAGQHLYLVECKRYAQNKPIGVELVRSLYGVVEHEKATAGMLVTTSRFTRDALEFVDPIKYRMSLREFGDIKEWLHNHLHR